MTWQLVTGIICIDDQGSTINSFGNASNKTSNCDHHRMVTFYPNPMDNMLSLWLNEEITGLWLIKGKVSTEYKDFDFQKHFLY